MINNVVGSPRQWEVEVEGSKETHIQMSTTDPFDQGAAATFRCQIGTMQQLSDGESAGISLGMHRSNEDHRTFE